jgi:hypothetical protein
VGVASDFAGHAPRNKVGTISAAWIDGNAIHIDGYIYAADFPVEAAEIKRRQADLGFSFEARDLDVENANTDPLVVTACVFTGAAILLKNAAAYRLTSLAAAADRDMLAAAYDVVRELRPAAELIAASVRINSRQLRQIRR